LRERIYAAERRHRQDDGPVLPADVHVAEDIVGDTADEVGN
jgi:hypothetical protein